MIATPRTRITELFLDCRSFTPKITSIYMWPYIGYIFYSRSIIKKIFMQVVEIFLILIAVIREEQLHNYIYSWSIRYKIPSFEKNKIDSINLYLQHYGILTHC